MTHRNGENERWAFGGIRDEWDNLDRPIAVSPLYVPEKVKIYDRDRLFWRHANGFTKNYIRDGVPFERFFCTHPPKTVLPGPRLLEDFVRLAKYNDLAIENYARKWGVLGICRHNLPRTHARRLVGGGTTDVFCRRYIFEKDWEPHLEMGLEPLHLWRMFARRAKTILDVASKLYEGGVVDDCDNEGSFDQLLAMSGPIEKRRRQQMQILSGELNRWIALGNVRPFFTWNVVGSPWVSFGTTETVTTASTSSGELPYPVDCQGTTLFGALGIQLLMAVSRGRGLALCSGCGEPYSPSRRPNPKHRRYCQSCGIKAARRDASKRYRIRHR